MSRRTDAARWAELVLGRWDAEISALWRGEMTPDVFEDETGCGAEAAMRFAGEWIECHAALRKRNGRPAAGGR